MLIAEATAIFTYLVASRHRSLSLASGLVAFGTAAIIKQFAVSVRKHSASSIILNTILVALCPLIVGSLHRVELNPFLSQFGPVILIGATILPEFRKHIS